MVNVFRNLYVNFQELFSEFLGDIVVALVILMIGFAIGKILKSMIKKFLHSFDLDKILKKGAGIKQSSENAISNIVAYFVYFAAIITALGRLGITTTVLQILIVAGLVLLIIAIVLAVKDFIPNSFAGIIIYYKRPFQIGDYISVKDVEGFVERINLLETQLKTNKEDIIHVPNSILIKNQVRIKKL